MPSSYPKHFDDTASKLTMDTETEESSYESEEQNKSCCTPCVIGCIAGGVILVIIIILIFCLSGGGSTDAGGGSTDVLGACKTAIEACEKEAKMGDDVKKCKSAATAAFKAFGNKALELYKMEEGMKDKTPLQKQEKVVDILVVVTAEDKTTMDKCEKMVGNMLEPPPEQKHYSGLTDDEFKEFKEQIEKAKKETFDKIPELKAYRLLVKHIHVTKEKKEEAKAALEKEKELTKKATAGSA